MLPRFPRAGAIGSLYALCPSAACFLALALIQERRAEHLVSGGVVGIDAHDVTKRVCSLAPSFGLHGFAGESVPDHRVIRLLLHHLGEDVYSRLGHHIILTFCQTL